MSKYFELLQRLERETGSPIIDASQPRGSLVVSESAETDIFDREIVRLLHRLFASPIVDTPQVIAFADVEQPNGSSWICCRAAELLSTNANVCVMDANLQAPSLHHYFGLDNDKGLLNAVDDSGSVKEVIQKASTNLSVITTGRGEIAEKGNFYEGVARLVSNLRSDFDCVLIDSPAVRHAQALTTARLADGVVLVIQANSTKRDTARTVKGELESLNIRLLGAVLNNRTFPIPEKIYRRL